MGLFTNPLGHAGYPPRVTGTPFTQPSEVRAATQAEVNAAVIDYAYVSPLTLAAVSSLANFASPPPIGSTAPNTGAFTTLTTNSETITTPASSSTTGLAINTSGGTGVGETINTSAATVDALQLTNGGIKFTVAAPSPGASPVTANSRNGVVTFSGASIAAGATQAFVVNNSIVTTATHVFCSSPIGGAAGSALSLSSVISGTGTITITAQNGTGATTSTANLTFVFEVLD